MGNKEFSELIGEENKVLVRLFAEEFWNKGNLEAVDELMATDATIFLPGREYVCLTDFKDFAARLRDAFPDWYVITDELLAEGARVAERWTGGGTHQGEFQGIASTGRKVMLSGTTFYCLAGGKITEFRGLFDRATLMRQPGT